MPDATRTSIDKPSAGRRNKTWLAVQIILTAVVLWYIGKDLYKQAGKFRHTPLVLHPRWELIGASAGVVLLTYLVLIETWRRIVVAWGDTLAFGDAARIWFVSNLARYMPWSPVFVVAAMAELSRRRRISPATATAAAAINVVVNIASGFAIAFIAGYGAVDTLTHGHGTLYTVAAVAVFVGIIALPVLSEPLLRVVKRATGRDIAIGAMPYQVIYLSLAGNVVAWVLYGLAYRLLAIGVVGTAGGGVGSYVAVYALAYVIGYLAILIPAGAGVRELAQTDALPLLGLATAPQAVTIAICSRLLITLLEIAPGLFFLARGTRLRPQDPIPVDGTKP